MTDFNSLESKGQILDALVAKQEPGRQAGGDVLIACGADLQPEPIQWLWDGYLAQGKMHILAGPPGLGKTTIALGLAATVTIAGRWPDGTRSAAGSILVWSGEDDPADTLLPRLLAAGADRNRCFFIQGARDEDGQQRPFDPARDIASLQIAMQRIGDVRLLVVDPIVSAVAGDSHKNTEVRRALQPLVDMAASSHCAVLGISHFSKGGAGSEPAQRVVGSVAFSAVARVVLAVAKTKTAEGDEQRILARAKSNIGPDNGGFEYQLIQQEPLPGIHASAVAWGKAVEGSARDLLAEPDDKEDAETDTDIQDILAQELAGGGWLPVNFINSQMAAHGFSKKQVWAASKRLEVKRKRGANLGAWYMALNPLKPGPEEAENVTEGDSIQPLDSQKEPLDSLDSTFRKTESRESRESSIAPVVTNSVEIEDVEPKREEPRKCREVM